MSNAADRDSDQFGIKMSAGRDLSLAGPNALFHKIILATYLHGYDSMLYFFVLRWTPPLLLH